MYVPATTIEPDTVPNACVYLEYSSADYLLGTYRNFIR